VGPIVEFCQICSFLPLEKSTGLPRGAELPHLDAEWPASAIELVIGRRRLHIVPDTDTRQIQSAQQRRLSLVNKEVVDQRTIVALDRPAVPVRHFLPFPAPPHMDINLRIDHGCSVQACTTLSDGKLELQSIPCVACPEIKTSGNVVRWG